MMETITVEGRGCVHVVPDVTRLDIKVKGLFKNYKEAYERAQQNSSMLVQVLEYNHLSGKMAKTIRLDISDHLVGEYDENDHYIGQTKDGVELDQTFKIDLDMDTVLLNKIVRGVGKFIENAQISIGYTVKDTKPFQMKILERAVKDALEKANMMAKAAECVLGAVNDISYQHQELHIYSEARSIHSSKEALVCPTSSLDITPDDLSVNDCVCITWQLKQLA